MTQKCFFINFQLPRKTWKCLSTPQADPPLLTCSIRHGLSNGDVVSVGGGEFEVRTVSDSQFYALGVEEAGEAEVEETYRSDSSKLDGQIVSLIERASDFDVEFVSAINFR